MKNWFRKWLGIDAVIEDVNRFDRNLLSQHYQMQIYLADKINSDETRDQLKRIADKLSPETAITDEVIRNRHSGP